MSLSPEFSDVCHTIQFPPMYVTQPRILLCMSHSPVFSNILRCMSQKPSYLQCMSHSLEFSDVCHTTQFFPMYVTQPRILQCMSHHPVFSDVCHIAQNSPMYVTPPSFLTFLQCILHSQEFRFSIRLFLRFLF